MLDNTSVPCAESLTNFPHFAVGRENARFRVVWRSRTCPGLKIETWPALQDLTQKADSFANFPFAEPGVAEDETRTRRLAQPAMPDSVNSDALLCRRFHDRLLQHLLPRP